MQRADAPAILASSGVSKEDGQMIAHDLKAMATELQKNVKASSKAVQ